MGGNCWVSDTQKLRQRNRVQMARSIHSFLLSHARTQTALFLLAFYV